MPVLLQLKGNLHSKAYTRFTVLGSELCGGAKPELEDCYTKLVKFVSAAIDAYSPAIQVDVCLTIITSTMPCNTTDLPTYSLSLLWQAPGIMLDLTSLTAAKQVHEPKTRLHQC